jgi:cytochrome c
MQGGEPIGPDLATVKALRRYITYLNKKNGTSLYVKLQGRGPRKVNGRKYFQSLPLKFATTADVYVYERH